MRCSAARCCNDVILNLFFIPGFYCFTYSYTEEAL